MARFTAYRARDGHIWLLDCQADALSHLTTRVVVPLLPRDRVPTGLTRLHPVFQVDGSDFIMATHLLSAVPVRELGSEARRLDDQHDRIMAALDMLITGI